MDESRMDGEMIICPYCDHKHCRGSEMEFSSQEKEMVEECEKCWKKFNAWFSTSVSYHTKRDCEINDEKHEFKLLGTAKSIWECVKCGQLSFDDPEKKEEVKDGGQGSNSGSSEAGN